MDKQEILDEVVTRMLRHPRFAAGWQRLKEPEKWILEASAGDREEVVQNRVVGLRWSWENEEMVLGLGFGTDQFQFEMTGRVAKGRLVLDSRETFMGICAVGS